MFKFMPIAVLMTLILPIVAHADNGHSGDDPIGHPYRLVSDLVPMPEFLPGMGKLYVDPATLPAGPFLAYDRNNELVSTIYMIPLADMNNKQKFTHLTVAERPVEFVNIDYNPGHPGVAEPHYHITLYHVDPETAALK